MTSIVKFTPLSGFVHALGLVVFQSVSQNHFHFINHSPIALTHALDVKIRKHTDRSMSSARTTVRGHFSDTSVCSVAEPFCAVCLAGHTFAATTAQLCMHPLAEPHSHTY
jgi:hypothetical protein